MIRGFYAGRTGAVEHQKAMAVAANNMANVNTDGYKTSNLSFQELLYQRVRMPDDYEAGKSRYDMNVRANKGLPPIPPGYDPEDEDMPSPVNYFSENKLRVGAGGRSTESAIVMTQGAVKQTGNALDIMLKGDGFLAVMDRTGGIAYTKQGAFQISAEDGEEYLVTSTGEYVLDENYDIIVLPKDRSQLRFAAHFAEYGEYDEEGGETVVRLGLFSCDNIYGLSRMGENKFAATEFSGEMNLVESTSNIDIIPYSLEMSNVSIAEEMVKVIQAQRAFQSNLTVIRTADEIEGYINGLKV